MAPPSGIPVIDLFAGPGGLGEGFASLRDARGAPVFRIALSVEKDRVAHRTLTLRAFYRQFPDGDAPEAYYDYLKQSRKVPDTRALFDLFPDEAAKAQREALCEELGESSAERVSGAISEALGGSAKGRPLVMIGGPPCQAYSLVGRARMLRSRGAWFYQDHRHTLYQEYLRLIGKHLPTVFVMENVKGLLSSKTRGSRLIFEQILKELSEPRRGQRYDLVALAPGEGPGLFAELGPEDEAPNFVVEAERFGVPQARHRVIIVGILRAARARRPSVWPTLRSQDSTASLRDAIRDLPPIRSRLSDASDSADHWAMTVAGCVDRGWFRQVQRAGPASLVAAIRRAAAALAGRPPPVGKAFTGGLGAPSSLARALRDDRLGGVTGHESRSHMAEDLHRYLFAACFAEEHKRSPKLGDFPSRLQPHHRNVSEALQHSLFADRFRVQMWDRPATTITSHCAKDGHYFIHPDPQQVRSLTVREAARLQTFPDNYSFEGPRTEQYRQVGNAVPPMLARQIAEAVASAISRS